MLIRTRQLAVTCAPLFHTVILLTTLYLMQVSFTSASASTRSTQPRQSSATVLVAFTEGTSPQNRDALFDQLNAELIKWFPEIDVAEIALRENAGAVRSASIRASSLQNLVNEHPAIESFEYNRVVHGTYEPNDPAFGSSSQTYAHELTNLKKAWNLSKGRAEVIIAVLDTGINASHPELIHQIVPGYNFVADSSDTNDDNGHGTHVAGIIGAAMDNDLGSAGVCPGCKLMPVKVLDEHNIGLWSVIVDGILFATDQGAQIINMSLGSAEHSVAVQRALEYAQQKGVFLVAAAGNTRSREYFYPAAYAGVLSVAATDNNDQEWSLSNRGAYIDIAAPGYLIYSTSTSEESFNYMTGTSMASPFVAGLAGLLLSQSPHRTATDLTELILYSATDLGAPGWDPTFGFGRIDAYAALSQTQGASEPIPARESSEISTLFLPLISH